MLLVLAALELVLLISLLLSVLVVDCGTRGGRTRGDVWGTREESGFPVSNMSDFEPFSLAFFKGFSSSCSVSSSLDIDNIALCFAAFGRYERFFFTGDEPSDRAICIALKEEP